MLLVGPVVPVLPVTGVMITGNDAGKALRLQAYYEATDFGRTLFAVRMRECKRNGCDGRCPYGRAFGRGFDSRLVQRKEESALCRLLFVAIKGIERPLPQSYILEFALRLAPHVLRGDVRALVI